MADNLLTTSPDLLKDLPTVADVCALEGDDPALVTFKAWADLRAALAGIDDGAACDVIISLESSAYRRLVNTAPTSLAGVAAINAAIWTVDEGALEDHCAGTATALATIFRSSFERAKMQAAA